MTTTTSTIERINIIYEPNVHVERTQPAKFAKYMIPSIEEWESFCDEIDKQLEPLERSVKSTIRTTYAYIGLFFIIFLASMSLRMDFFGPILTLIVAIGVNVAIILLRCNMKSKMIAIHDEIISTINQKVSSMSSNYISNVQVRAHTEYRMFQKYYKERQRYTSYLEIEITTNNILSANNKPSDPIIEFMTTESDGNKILTTAEQLEELETIKHLLSPSEYEDKRAGIISKV